MNNKLTIFSLIVFSIFISSFSSAVAPTTTIFYGDYGINVEVNVMPTYKLGEARWTIIHLFNSTNGLQITNETHNNISCHMHLRNSQGFELFDIEAEVHEDHWDLNGSGGGNNPIGNYAWTLTCQNTNVGGYASGYFEITPNGLSDTLGFYFIILILSLGIVILGFYLRDPTITILGSFGLYFIGLYILFFGIDGMMDQVYTWAIGIIILMMAAYISIRSAYELIVD